MPRVMQGRQRIAIYGGTFDPVHRGHLAVAKKTVELFEITRLLFVPALHAPHKLEREVSAPLHRYTMLALATRDERQLFVSSFEIDAPGRHYTIDTLEHFQKVEGESADLFFVMGADSWSEITSWRQWERLITLANHIVVTRPGYEIAADNPKLAERVVDVRGREASSVSRTLNQAAEPRVYISDVANIDISATEIRESARVNRVDELERLVPASIAEYITKYGIYKNRNET